MAGIVLNLPWSKGDQFWVEGAYTVGAVSYTGWNQNGQYSSFVRFNGNQVAAAWPLDAVFANVVGAGTAGLNGSGLELTTVWTIAASLQHYWTPALRTSVFGAYTATDYNANASNIFCSSPNSPVRTAAGAATSYAGNTFNSIAGCNPDFNVWGIGTRTIWNPVPNLDIGVEVVYTKLQQNMDPNTTRLSFAGAGGRAAGLYTPSDVDVWSGMLRFQRNFWP
jgi:hypothetical protein